MRVVGGVSSGRGGGDVSPGSAAHRRSRHARLPFRRGPVVCRHSAAVTSVVATAYLLPPLPRRLMHALTAQSRRARRYNF